MGNVAVTSSTITNCVASGGGAIGSVGGGTVTVSSSTITNCSATSGGAIYNLEGTLAVESSSTISDCTAAVFGGAIATEEGTDAITSSTISDCTAGAGGAIYSEDGSVTLEGSSTVTGCSAINGGAIATEEGTDTITSSTISDCTATEFGGAIVTELGSVTITSSKIAGSSATEAGGAIGLIGNATISSSTITGCSAGLIGGAIWFEGGETPGLSPDIAMSLPLTTSLTSAVGPKGSGPFSFTLPSVSPPSVDDFGPTNLTLTTTTISGCSAGYGGGLYSEGGNVTITSSTITGSTASETGGGGAINTSILQSGTMQFSQIYNNSVPEVTNGAIVPIAPGFTIPTLTATDNFWGTNSPSSGIVGGNVDLTRGWYWASPQHPHPSWLEVHQPSRQTSSTIQTGTTLTPPVMLLQTALRSRLPLFPVRAASIPPRVRLPPEFHRLPLLPLHQGRVLYRQRLTVSRSLYQSRLPGKARRYRNLLLVQR